MKVALLTLQDDLNCYGVRCLSSVLREQGVSTELLYLGRGGPHEARLLTGAARPPLPPAVVDQIAERCADADVIGLSVMTLYYEESAELSDALRRRLGVPVVWGGIHPLCDPAGSLRHADAICIGEAEESLPELLARLDAGDDLGGLPGVWFRRGHEVVSNPRRNPSADLDRFPAPDYSLDGHFVYWEGALRPLTREILLERLDRLYMTIDARGCPLRCTYCCNSQMARRFDWTVLRRKSVPRMMEEIRGVLHRYPEIEGVKLSDDAFGDLPLDYIREFAEQYKKAVGLPLGIPGFSPRNLTRGKLEPLVDAGLVYVRLGIQSGSPRIRKLYGRHDTNEEIVRAVEEVQRCMPPIERLKLDLITDNPWEDPSDSVESIRLLQRLSKPYELAVFSLTLFPGTPLHLKARREGLLDDEGNLVYRKHFHNVSEKNPWNRILQLFTRPVVLAERIDDLLACADDPDRFEYRLGEYLEALARVPATERPRLW